MTSPLPRRGRALDGARAALLAGPVALAFFSGGYFDQARSWAGLVAWALVALAAALAWPLLPRSSAGRLATAGLVALAGWTLLSLTWAPLAGVAYHDGQRVFLYAGALIAAAALLRGRASRAVEPALAGGALIVIGYGISERLLPGVLTFQRSLSAAGRLDQPLTYWNATGEVAALGLVMCARMAGDATRPARLRIAGVAAAGPLGMGLYLTFSRGALFAFAAGMLTLIVVAPNHAQLRGAALALAAAVAAALCAAPFSALTSLAGSHSTRVGQGTAGLLLLLAVTAAVAAVAPRVLRTRDPELASHPLPLPRRAPLIALGLIVGAFALFLAVGAKERSARPLSTGANRLATLQSNRFSYWRVALRAFRAEPVRGVGGGGWAVYWRRYRPFAEGAQDAHSLYVQTLAELGLVGVALLAAYLGGIGWSGRRAHRLAPLAAAGPIAGVVVWVCHVAVDWDWEMPAATLPAILLAGTLLALADEDAPAYERRASTSVRASATIASPSAATPTQCAARCAPA